MRHFFQTNPDAPLSGAAPRSGLPVWLRARWGRAARARAVAALVACIGALVFLGQPTTVERLAEHSRRSRVPEADRQTSEVLLRRIDWAAANGQTVEVARLCAALCVLHPDDPAVLAARERRIEALMLLGDEPGVVDELHHLLQLDRRSPQLPELLAGGGRMADGAGCLP